MNYRGQRTRAHLPVCPVCGMDSGERMVADGKVPEEYYVVCQVCGFRTKPHPTPNAAGREWGDMSRRKV